MRWRGGTTHGTIYSNTAHKDGIPCLSACVPACLSACYAVRRAEQRPPDVYVEQAFEGLCVPLYWQCLLAVEAVHLSA